MLFNEFTKHCTTLENLEHSLKSENSTVFMEGILILSYSNNDKR